MEITYEVEDGYVGQSRPQTVKIDDDEITECESAEEAMAIIENAVQNDFEQKISWAFVNREQILIAVNRLLAQEKL